MNFVQRRMLVLTRYTTPPNFAIENPQKVMVLRISLTLTYTIYSVQILAKTFIVNSLHHFDKICYGKYFKNDGFTYIPHTYVQATYCTDYV